MTRDQANVILDQVKDGLPVDDEQILLALMATGDLAGWKDEYRDGNLASGVRGEVLEEVIQIEAGRVGEAAGEGMVVADEKPNPRKKRAKKS